MGDRLKEEKVEFQIVQIGKFYRCTYLNDHRIHGGKPYVSEGSYNLVSSTINMSVILDAFPAIKHINENNKKLKVAAQNVIDLCRHQIGEVDIVGEAELFEAFDELEALAKS